MSRYTGSIFKRSRRLGFSLLENDKEFSKGKKRTYAPGQHGNKRVKLSGYGEQLQEKQKLMYMYGLNDRQFRRFFKIARGKEGVLTINLLQTLESRLDSLVYRMGFAPTRRAARQMVSHGHILLNGKKCDIPSALVNVGDIISVKEKTKAKIDMDKALVADFVDVDKKKLEGKFKRLPERSELPENINESYVVE